MASPAQSAHPVQVMPADALPFEKKAIVPPSDVASAPFDIPQAHTQEITTVHDTEHAHSASPAAGAPGPALTSYTTEPQTMLPHTPSAPPTSAAEVVAQALEAAQVPPAGQAGSTATAPTAAENAPTVTDAGVPAAVLAQPLGGALVGVLPGSSADGKSEIVTKVPSDRVVAAAMDVTAQGAAEVLRDAMSLAEEEAKVNAVLVGTAGDLLPPPGIDIAENVFEEKDNKSPGVADAPTIVTAADTQVSHDVVVPVAEVEVTAGTGVSEEGEVAPEASSFSNTNLTPNSEAALAQFVTPSPEPVFGGGNEPTRSPATVSYLPLSSVTASEPVAMSTLAVPQAAAFTPTTAPVSASNSVSLATSATASNPTTGFGVASSSFLAATPAATRAAAPVAALATSLETADLSKVLSTSSATTSLTPSPSPNLRVTTRPAITLTAPKSPHEPPVYLDSKTAIPVAAESGSESPTAAPIVSPQDASMEDTAAFHDCVPSEGDSATGVKRRREDTEGGKTMVEGGNIANMAKVARTGSVDSPGAEMGETSADVAREDSDQGSSFQGSESVEAKTADVATSVQNEVEGNKPDGNQEKALRIGGRGLFLRSAPVGATDGDAGGPDSGTVSAEQQKPAKRKKSVRWVPDDELVEVHDIYTRIDLIRNWDPESEITLPFAPNTLSYLRGIAEQEDRGAGRGGAARPGGGLNIRSAPPVNEFEEARRREHEREQELARGAKQKLQVELDAMKPSRKWYSPVTIILPSECRPPSAGDDGNGEEGMDRMDTEFRGLGAIISWLGCDAVAQPITGDSPAEPPQGVEYETEPPTARLPLYDSEQCDVVDDAGAGSNSGEGWAQGEFGKKGENGIERTGGQTHTPMAGNQPVQKLSPPQRFMGSTAEDGGGNERISPTIPGPPPPGIAAAVQAVASSIHGSLLPAPSTVPSAPVQQMPLQQLLASLQSGQPSHFPPGMPHPPPGMGMPPFPPHPGMFTNGMPMGMLPPGMPLPPGMSGMGPQGMSPGMMPPHMMNSTAMPPQFDSQASQQKSRGARSTTGEQAQCRYFRSKNGCRDGARCPFRHC